MVCYVSAVCWSLQFPLLTDLLMRASFLSSAPQSPFSRTSSYLLDFPVATFPVNVGGKARPSAHVGQLRWPRPCDTQGEGVVATPRESQALLDHHFLRHCFRLWGDYYAYHQICSARLTTPRSTRFIVHDSLCVLSSVSLSWFTLKSECQDRSSISKAGFYLCVSLGRIIYRSAF